jgi:hypothetical protein
LEPANKRAHDDTEDPEPTSRKARDVLKAETGGNTSDGSRDSADPSHGAGGNAAPPEVEHAPESKILHLGIFRSLISLLPGTIFLELAF